MNTKITNDMLNNFQNIVYFLVDEYDCCTEYSNKEIFKIAIETYEDEFGEVSDETADKLLVHSELLKGWS